MRRCKSKECSNALQPASQCTDVVSKKGYCSIECLSTHTTHKRIEAEERRKAKELKEMRERVESQGNKSKLMQRAQTAFNAFIRERDKAHGCISCGSTKETNGITGSNFDAGHYRSRGANPELRFNEDNVFRQCVSCNRDNSGNVVNMRIGILKRIGQERLDIIEGPHLPKKYTADDLREIAVVYKAKLKELKSLQN